MDSGIRSLESIPGLLKHLKIGAQATLASGIGSLESIPRLLEHLQIRAQATLASRIGSLESIPRLHNMKNNNGNDIKTKAEQSFDLEFVFDIEAKRTFLFQNL